MYMYMYMYTMQQLYNNYYVVCTYDIMLVLMQEPCV